MSSEKLSVVMTSTVVPVVNFTDRHFTPAEKRKMSVDIFTHSDKGYNKKRKVVMAETPNKMVFKGDNFGLTAEVEKNTEFYVAKVNKVTSKMTLFPAELFHMHQTVNDTSQREKLDLDSMSFIEKNDALTMAFGSAKQKRNVKQRRKSKVAAGAATAAVSMGISIAKMSQENTPVQAPQETSSAIPPYNKAAETPADVYKLHDIVGPLEINSLRSLVEELKTTGSDLSDKEYHQCVLSRVKQLPMDAEKREEQACLLLYLQYMVSMHHMKHGDLRRKDPLPETWPEPVKHMMLDRFTHKMDGQRRCTPARLKDLLLSHILVLCLILDDFTTPLSDLTRDLHIPEKKLQIHFRALGCKLKKESIKDSSGDSITSSVARLKVPLTFPEPSKGRKSKK